MQINLQSAEKSAAFAALGKQSESYSDAGAIYSSLSEKQEREHEQERYDQQGVAKGAFLFRIGYYLASQSTNADHNKLECEDNDKCYADKE